MGPGSRQQRHRPAGAYSTLEVEGAGDRGKVSVAEGKMQPLITRRCSSHRPGDIGERVDKLCLQ